MAPTKLPLAILGGSDRTAGYLPPSGHDQHSLSGCKGVDIRIGGRRLIEVLVDRYRENGHFDPIYVAGPAAAYRDVLSGVEVFDTDGGFGRNLQICIERLAERHPGRQLAMSTCDILPEPAELDGLLADYRRHAPCDLWFPLIRAPQDLSVLGESKWKPRYRVTPSAGEPTLVLPSHLAVFDPEAMRLGFLYRLLDVAYQTRNRPVLYRRAHMLRRLITGLLLHDLRQLVTLRLPNVTWDVVRYGYAASLKLGDGTATQTEIEYVIRRMFTARRHRLAHPDRLTRLPVLDGMSFARDIDTLEEAKAMSESTGDRPSPTEVTAC